MRRSSSSVASLPSLYALSVVFRDRAGLAEPEAIGLPRCRLSLRLVVPTAEYQPRGGNPLVATTDDD